jgi:hypothetical protein
MSRGVAARGVRAALAAIAVAGGVIVVVLPASGQARRAGGHPDLSGFWSLASNVAPDRRLIDRLPANTVLVKDTGAVELPAGDFGGLKVKPEALAAAKKWTPDRDMTLDKVCAPPSIVYAMQGPFPIEIHQATELIVMKMEYFDQVRIIFMDGRSHPPANAPHSKVGHSIGRWEGDTLVVDTTHLSASTITNNGLDHTDNVHVIERFMLADDGKTLISTQEFEDPDVLENRGARFIAWTRQPGQYVFPYECDPTFGLEYSKRLK